MGRFAEAEPDLREARAIYEKIGDRQGLADVLDEFGVLHEGRGEYARARKAYQEALRIRRDLGDERQLAQSYDNVGYVFFLEGEYDNALVYWQQALDLRRKIGDKAGSSSPCRTWASSRRPGPLGGGHEVVPGRAREGPRDRLQERRGGLPRQHRRAPPVRGALRAALASYDEALAVLRRSTTSAGSPSSRSSRRRP